VILFEAINGLKYHSLSGKTSSNEVLMYFDRHFSLISGYRYLLKDVIKFLNDINSMGSVEKTLVDVGCGKMPYKRILSNWTYVGIDNVTESDATPDLYGDLTNLPLRDKECDLLLTVWVLDDVFQLDKAFKEMERVLKDDGMICLIENQSTNLHNHPYDYFRFSPSAIERLGKENGLTVVEVRSYGGDFALIGFSLIIIFRNFFNLMKLDLYARPFYCSIINLFFRPLDRFFSLDVFNNRFKGNSIGHCYTLKKIILEK
jgi:SAM-dependent methyltransferase